MALARVGVEGVALEGVSLEVWSLVYLNGVVLLCNFFDRLGVCVASGPAWKSELWI